MSDTGNAFRAGLVIVAGSIIAVMFFFASKKTTLDDANSVPYYALLSDAAGVNAKSLITVAGLQVGEIKHIGLVEMPLHEYVPDLGPRSVEVLAPFKLKDDKGAVVHLVEPHDDFDQMIAAYSTRGKLPTKEALGLEVEKRKKAKELTTDEQVFDWEKRQIDDAVKQLGKEKVRVARVDMRVSKDVPIPKDTWVRKESLGVLGAKALFLELGPSTEMLERDARINNVRSLTGMDTLLSRATGIVSDVESITHRLDQDIGGITGDIRGITAELNRFVNGDGDSPPLDELYKMVMTDLRRLSNTVEKAVRDANSLIKDNDGELNKLIANVQRISGDIAELTGKGDGEPGPDGGTKEGDIRATMSSVRKVADDLTVVTSQLKTLLGENEEEVGEGIKNLQETIKELNRSLTSLSEVAGRVERGEGTVGRLLTDEKMADKVESAVSGASDFVASLTSLETHVDVGTYYSFNRGVGTAMLGLKLQPKPDKFYLVEIVDDGGRVESFTTVDNEGGTTRRSTRIEDNSLRITAMFAKRFFDFLVLRAGIIETTGGLGANVFFFDDRVELRSDLFNFRGPRDTLYTDPLNAFYLPRWRTMVKAQPIPHIYLTAGVDDVLNSIGPAGFQPYTDVNGYGFDYFFGAGLTFKDDDLRSILPFIPGG